jgi:asparagine synthase (glutamine-hydrolysing)
MSGIAGIIRFDGGPVEPDLIEKMTASMAYRGPDGINHWVQGSVALGQCMLRTTPESLDESQPLHNDDSSLVLVMDGRVDNWEELRSELLARGARLRTRADAELVLRAYEVWGEECMPHIDGDFAFVIWNARTRTAFCARDQMGNKLFNYHWDGKTLVFASEVHAILAMPWIEQIPNEGLFAEYLGNEWYSRHETPWQGLTRLIPAHRMRVTSSGCATVHYWQPDYAVTLPFTSETEMAEHYFSLLERQVRRMSRSAYPVACEVSGGLDSSALFALLAKLQRNQDLPAPGFAGYGLAIPDDAAANEIDYMRVVGSFVGHTIKEVPATQAPLDWFETAARTYKEFPSYPNGTMSLDLRTTARAEGARVVMTGIGGDEWVGMPWYGSAYTEEMALLNVRNAYQCFKRDCGDIGGPTALKWFLRYGLAPFAPQPMKRSAQALLQLRAPTSRPKAYWLSAHYQDLLAERRAAFQAKKPPALARRGQSIQYRILLGAYEVLSRELEERQNARLGVELRSPFNSRAIIECAFATPERFRTQGRTTKVLHRRAFADLLPECVVKRTSKADFMGTFRTQLKDLGRERIVRTARERGDWVKTEGIDHMVDNLQNCVDLGSVEWKLWTLIGCHSLPR